MITRRTLTIAACAFCLLFAAAVQGQQQDKQKMMDAAQEYLMAGDFNNAVVIYNRLLQQDPKDLEVLKKLAYAYYLKKDLVSAMNTAESLTDRPDADVQTYQILGLIYKALEKRKDAEKMYRAALRKFPASGALYNEYGEMLWAREDFREAISQWEKGIESDPNYPGNYYNAAKYYYFSTDKIWGLLYGEIFVNLESYSARTSEIKDLLLQGYKKLFADADMFKHQDSRNEFVNAVLTTFRDNAAAVNTGITLENLHTFRMNFIRQWDQANAAKYPFRLFQHQNQLLEMGLLEAYDQWLFADLFKAGSYESWGEQHLRERTEFRRLQQNRVFKIPSGQYYKNGVK